MHLLLGERSRGLARLVGYKERSLEALPRRVACIAIGTLPGASRLSAHTRCAYVSLAVHTGHSSRCRSGISGFFWQCDAGGAQGNARGGVALGLLFHLGGVDGGGLCLFCKGQHDGRPMNRQRLVTNIVRAL